MGTRIDITQPSFAGGEITPALASREDLAKQQVSVETCRNLIVTRTGSVKKRGGLLKIARVQDSDNQHRLIPFTFDRDTAFLVEFGNLTTRFVKNDALILIDIVDAAYKWTLSADGTSNYYLELAAGGDPGLLKPQTVLQNSATMSEGTLGNLGTSQWAYGDSAGDGLGYDTIYVRISDSADPDSKAQGYLQVPYQIASPYTSAQNTDIDYTQSANVMFQANKNFMPYSLSRISDDDWTLVLTDFQDGPWLAFEDGDEEITMTPDAKTGSGVTIQCSDTFPHPNSSVVGGIIRLGYENPFDASIIEWSWCTITGIGTSTTRVVTIEKNLGYEYLLNPDFEKDISSWQNRSTGSLCDVTYDDVNQLLVLFKDVTGDAIARQEVTVPKYEKMTLEIDVDTVSTSFRVYIGTTAGATDVLGVQTIVAPGSYSYDTLPNQPGTATVFVSLDTGGAPVSTTHKISRVSLMSRGLGTPHWRVGVFSSDNTYPSHVTLHEERLMLAGGSLNLPDTGWTSKIGGYTEFPFNTPPIDTDGVTFTLASKEVNAIQHITPFKELVIGTIGSEWKVDPGPNGETITPTTISAKEKSNVGCAAIKPLIADKSLLFLNRNTNKIYALTYSFDLDGYKPAELTVLAPHLFEGYTITEWAYQESPDSIVWCVRNDGVLLGLTYIEEQEIWAWHRHDTVGKIESVAVIPEGGEDALYVITNRKRNVAGIKETQRYIEKMLPQISDEDIYDFNCLDNSYSVDIENDIASSASINGITYLTQTLEPDEFTHKEHVRISYPIAGAADVEDGDYIYLSGIVGPTELNGKTFIASDVDSGGGNWRFKIKDKEGLDYVDGAQFADWVSGGEIRKGITSVFFHGLEYLNGYKVGVLADGSYITKTIAVFDEPATKWGFTLDAPAIVINIGVPYKSDLITLPIDIAGQEGTTQGKNKNIVRGNVYFNKTRHARIGYDEDHLKNISFETKESLETANPPPLYTGIQEKTFDSKDGKIVKVMIRNDVGLPMEIMGIIPNVDISAE
jgi:hypothetical protein